MGKVFHQDYRPYASGAFEVISYYHYDIDRCSELVCSLEYQWRTFFKNGSVLDLINDPIIDKKEKLIVDGLPFQENLLSQLKRLDEEALLQNAQIILFADTASADRILKLRMSADWVVFAASKGFDRAAALRGVFSAGKDEVKPRGGEVAQATVQQNLEDISRKLDRILSDRDGGSFHNESAGSAIHSQSCRHERASTGGSRQSRAALPDPLLIRDIVKARQRRERYFDADLFADPAWDMLLDLTVARAEHKRVSVTSLCIASGVPPTTALRWISQMTESGLLQRIEDEQDRRRAFIALTDRAAANMASYFQDVGATLN